VINSLATSVTSLTPHLSAIVACFDFWRKICHPAFSDFCNTIAPKADFDLRSCDVADVPIAAVSRCSTECYSITSSARASSKGGTSRPSAFAVLRLITNSNLVGC
jgi:hypothetical protein